MSRHANPMGSMNKHGGPDDAAMRTRFTMFHTLLENAMDVGNNINIRRQNLCDLARLHADMPTDEKTISMERAIVAVQAACTDARKDEAVKWQAYLAGQNIEFPWLASIVDTHDRMLSELAACLPGIVIGLNDGTREKLIALGFRKDYPDDAPCACAQCGRHIAPGEPKKLVNADTRTGAKSLCGMEGWHYPVRRYGWYCKDCGIEDGMSQDDFLPFG